MQSSAYGKTGHSVHGSYCLVRRFKPNVEATLHQLYSDLPASDAAAAAAPLLADRDNWDGFSRYSFVLAARESQTQTGYTALCMLEVTVQRLGRACPWATSLLVHADNGSTYHCSTFVLGVPHIAERHGMTARRLWFCTPGHGKDWVDHTFGTVKGTVKAKLAAGLDVPTGVHFVAVANAGTIRRQGPHDHL